MAYINRAKLKSERDRQAAKKVSGFLQVLTQPPFY